jgi:hypothetical protein
MIWNFLKASKFFPSYCPEIRDWKKKITGKNGRGNPVEFSAAEKKQIKTALKSLFKDLEGSIK